MASMPRQVPEMAQTIAPGALPIIPPRYFLFKLDLTGVILSLSFSSGHPFFSMLATSFIGVFKTWVWIISNKTGNVGVPGSNVNLNLTGLMAPLILFPGVGY
jgi:hypothetical protein